MTNEKRRVFTVSRVFLARTGKVLFLMLACGCGMISQAHAETFLSEQAITISGKVTAPSCQAQLNTDTLSFISDNQHSLTVKGTSLNSDKQVLILHLSDCDFNGLGVKFNAESQVDYPERGVLRDTLDNAVSTSSYYTIGLDTSPQQDVKILSLAQDSPVLVKDSESHQYFRLNKEEYWFDIHAVLSNGEGMNVPFDVSIHDIENRASGGDVTNDPLEAKFTLELSYR